MKDAPRDDEFVKELFDRMGPTYALTNVVSSFGFSEMWRRSCVKGAKIKSQSVVCDLMAGSGECWRYIPQNIEKIISLDFSTFMCERQLNRKERESREISVLSENATKTSIAAGTVDHVFSCFGLKTLSEIALANFAQEIERILKPGGTFSLLEISRPESKFIRLPYEWYLCRVIPLVGKLLLGDIECYRMLGRYTTEFGSCEKVIPNFAEVGLNVDSKKHFFGCATSIIGTKVS